MDQFEYLSVLISIIVGLGITHLLTGVGRFLGGPDAPRVFGVHVAWTVNLILYQSFFWWFTFTWVDQETWTFGLFARGTGRLGRRSIPRREKHRHIALGRGGLFLCLPIRARPHTLL